MTLFNAQGNYLNGPGLELSTRLGNRIPNEQRLPRLPASMEAANNIVRNAHPDIQVRSLSSVYNCMGMVFASRRTWVETDHLQMILEEDGYHQVPDERDLQPGDVVVYKDDDGQVSHVGIVARRGLELPGQPPQLFVLSQWGQDGEYFHQADDVNPRLGKPAEYWTDRI